MLPVNLFGGKRVPNPPPGVSRYSVGKKTYGAGRPMPNIGPVSNMLGYNERDNKLKAKRSALLRRLKGQNTGNPLNKNIITGGGFGG